MTYELTYEELKTENIFLKKELEFQLQINNDNSFLAEFSFQLANLSDKDVVKDIALPQINEYTGASYAHFAIYDTNQKALLLQHIETDDTLLNMIIKVAGNKIFETKSLVSEEAYKQIITQNINIINSITELSFGAISPLIDKALRKVTGLYHFYGVAQINSGNLYGVTLLAFKKNDTLPSAYLLKMYSNLLAVSLKRKQAEEALKVSEEKYRLISDNALDGVSLLEDNKITYISDGYLKMLGYGIEDILGISLEDAINLAHKDDLDFLKETIANAYKNRIKELSYEYRIKTITGKYIWIENRTRIEYYENGKHKRSIIHTRNITDRKEAEIQKNYLSAIIENTENICVIKDLDLKVIATNESFVKAAGKNSVKDLIGKTDAEIFEVSPEVEPIKGYMMNDLKAQKLKKGEKIVREENVIYPDKSVKTVLTTKFPVYNNNNKLIATANISTDITKLKEAERQIKRQNKKLKKLNDDKNRFISILAHDLKSPFTSILGFINLLTKNVRKYDINKIEELINIINNSAQNTFNLLEDILIWVRANSGKIPFEPQELHLSNMCKDIIENLILTANTKNIKINHFVVDEVTVFADKDMLNTVLRNLVSNAIKFTDKNGRIDIYAEQYQTNITITVSDNGVGIEPDALNRLFDISQKITTEGTENEQGTGLGLLLCKEFVDKHSGKIWVESEVGKGSDFKFTLPIKK